MNGNCPFSVVAWQENRVIENATAPHWGRSFHGAMPRPGVPSIIWAEFSEFVGENRELQLGRIFPDELNEVSVDYTCSRPKTAAGSNFGALVRPKVWQAQPPSALRGAAFRKRWNSRGYL
ncbi:MAG: hypothetical protein U1G07_27290 [Verrucomicrobiota bacterium]